MKKSSRAQLRIFHSIKRCTCGKPIYDKKGAASAKNLRMRIDHEKLRIYQCPQAEGGWHLTHHL